MALEQYQVEILEALEGAGASSIRQTLALVTYTEEFKTLKEDLHTMLEAGLVTKYSNLTWNLSQVGKRMIKAHRGGKDAEIPKPDNKPLRKPSEVKNAEPVASAKPPEDKVQQGTHKALAAFDRVAGKKGPVKDLELKLEVLARLRELLAPDIAGVLNDISNDLKQ